MRGDWQQKLTDEHLEEGGGRREDGRGGGKRQLAPVGRNNNRTPT
jgi:hypothetical protein